MTFFDVYMGHGDRQNSADMLVRNHAPVPGGDSRARARACECVVSAKKPCYSAVFLLSFRVLCDTMCALYDAVRCVVCDGRYA